jgi:hypothetical protein
MTGIVNVIHRPSEVMQLRARLSTLLQLSLQPTKMIERQTALPMWPDTPITNASRTQGPAPVSEVS